MEPCGNWRISLALFKRNATRRKAALRKSAQKYRKKFSLRSKKLPKRPCDAQKSSPKRRSKKLPKRRHY